jgi:hypothetical protein
LPLELDFKLNVPDNPIARNKSLQIMLWALVSWDVYLLQLYRKAGKPLPPIYTADVRYIREPEGQEEWLDVMAVLKAKGGDCEDLAAWRCAELRVDGVPARPAWRHRIVENVDTKKQFSLYHIVVWTPSGIDDPSARLGMGGPSDV